MSASDDHIKEWIDKADHDLAAIQRKQFFDVVFRRHLTKFKAVAFGNYQLPKILTNNVQSV